MTVWSGAEVWLWASLCCCHPLVIAFAIQGCVIQLVLAVGYLVASKTRAKELKRIKDAQESGNSFAFLYPNVQDLESSVQEKLPRVAVIMPLKGIAEHNLSNWRSQVLSLYGGELEFLFVMESKEDPAYFAVSQLLLELQGQVQVRIVIAGLSTRCSQKVHNQLAGVDGMHKDTKYVLFLDDDVRLHPGTIGAVVAKMEENPKIFVLTGYPFDIPTRSLGAYCIYEYHLPCSIGFATGDQTFFLWGGFMMMHAEDFRCNRYGMVTGLQNGGYSDDMTLAAVAAANGRIISSPPMAVFFHPLCSNLSFSQYWNYLRKQTIVLETYITTVNYIMNRALFYSHCWLSWSVIFPSFATLVHIMAVLTSSLGSNSSFHTERRAALMLSGCAIFCKLIELFALRHLSKVEIDLCNALSPESPPVSIQSYDWFLVFIATIVDNFLYPVSAFISTYTQHINWAGVDYYFRNGRICHIDRPNKTEVKSSSGIWGSRALVPECFQYLPECIFRPQNQEKEVRK